MKSSPPRRATMLAFGLLALPATADPPNHHFMASSATADWRSQSSDGCIESGVAVSAVEIKRPGSGTMNDISVTHFLTDQCSGDVYVWSGSTTTDARLWSDAALSRARLVGAVPVEIFYSDGGNTFLLSGTVDVDLDWVGTDPLVKEVTDSGDGFQVNKSRAAAASGSVALRSDANIASGASVNAELTRSHLLLP